jgi:hypothetical protein
MSASDLNPREIQRTKFVFDFFAQSLLQGLADDSGYQRDIYASGGSYSMENIIESFGGQPLIIEVHTRRPQGPEEEAAYKDTAKEFLEYVYVPPTKAEQ